MTVSSYKGKLLVAAPQLQEPTFARTVISILEHSADGALGVVINRPGGSPIAEVVPPVAELVSWPAVLFTGGPVEPQAAIALGMVSAATVTSGADSGWRPVVHPVVTVDLDSDPAILAGSLRELRVFAGYAGWSRGQLEAEVAEGAWYVVESLPLDAFDSAPDQLWSAVLKRQPWPMSAVATCPADPSLN